MASTDSVKCAVDNIWVRCYRFNIQNIVTFVTADVTMELSVYNKNNVGGHWDPFPGPKIHIIIAGN